MFELTNGNAQREHQMKHEIALDSLQAVACSCDVAAGQVVFSYELGGTDTRVEDLDPARGDDPRCAGRAVILPGLGRVECVLDSSTDFGAAVEYLADFRADGWEVWALVPLARLGEAHLSFGRTADCVQGWWQRPEAPVSFTEPETA
jgi:hypothetical protein